MLHACSFVWYWAMKRHLLSLELEYSIRYILTFINELSTKYCKVFVNKHNFTNICCRPINGGESVNTNALESRTDQVASYMMGAQKFREIDGDDQKIAYGFLLGLLARNELPDKEPEDRPA